MLGKDGGRGRCGRCGQKPVPGIYLGSQQNPQQGQGPDVAFSVNILIFSQIDITEALGCSDDSQICGRTRLKRPSAISKSNTVTNVRH